MKARWQSADFFIVMMLLIGTFALYLKTRHFESLGYDDTLYGPENWHVATGLTWENIRWAFTAVIVANWHPVTMLTALSISTIFGPRASSFHLASAFFHSVNVALLFAFLFRATGMRWRAAIVAALWGFHPLRVESVAWISELKDVLCGFFWLWCMLAYLHYRERPGVARYSLVFITMALALLSKPMAVTLPGVLLMLDFWPLQLKWRWTLVEEKIPLVLLCLGTCAIAVYTQHGAGATGTLSLYPVHARLENALVSYCAYISKMVFPYHLSVFYPHPMVIGDSIPALKWIGAGILLIATTVISFRCLRSKPYVLVGWLWFIFTLLPVIGLVQVGDQAMADRYTYLPGIGLAFAIVWLAADWAQRSNPRRWVLRVAGTAALIGLIISASIQIGYWQNTRTIFARADTVTEKNFLAKATLANVDVKLPERRTEALALAHAAIEICPSHPYPHGVLATLYQEQGKYHEAFAEYERAIRLGPYEASNHSNFGGLLVKMGRDEDAIKQFQFVLRLDPTDAASRHNLAICLANHNHLDEALAQWQLAAHYHPEDGIIRGWLAEALRMKGDRNGAVQNYLAAWNAGERNTNWETNLVWLIATSPDSAPDKIESAVTIGRELTTGDGKNQPGALDAYAAALARAGRYDDAVSADRSALNLVPKDNASLRADITNRLASYQQGRAYITR